MFVLEGEAVTQGMMTGAEAYGSLASFGLLIVLFIAFYFILIRPQRKKDKELKEQMNNLVVGDKVVTIGGLVGFVANIKDSEVTISTSKANTLVTFTKSSIQAVYKRDQLNPDGSLKKVEEPEKTGLFGKKDKKEKAEKADKEASQKQDKNGQQN